MVREGSAVARAGGIERVGAGEMLGADGQGSQEVTALGCDVRPRMPLYNTEYAGQNDRRCESGQWSALCMICMGQVWNHGMGNLGGGEVT